MDGESSAFTPLRSSLYTGTCPSCHQWSLHDVMEKVHGRHAHGLPVVMVYHCRTCHHFIIEEGVANPYAALLEG